MPNPNIKRPTELQGGPVLLQEIGVDHADTSGCATRIGHDGLALLVKTETVSEESPPEQTAKLGVLVQPRLVLDTNQATRAGLLLLQSVQLADGDLVLLVNQTTGSQNGLYVVHANDSAGAARDWTRAKLPLYGGQEYQAQAGTHAGKVYRLTNVGTITLGVTTLTFEVVPGGSIGTYGLSGFLQTTDATPTVILTIPLEDNTVYRATVEVVGRQTNAGNRGGFVREFVVYREAAGGATQQGNALARVADIESVAGWDVTVDTVGNNARVIVTGAGGANINWRADALVRKVS